MNHIIYSFQQTTSLISQQLIFTKQGTYQTYDSLTFQFSFVSIVQAYVISRTLQIFYRETKQIQSFKWKSSEQALSNSGKKKTPLYWRGQKNNLQQTQVKGGQPSALTCWGVFVVWDRGGKQVWWDRIALQRTGQKNRLTMYKRTVDTLEAGEPVTVCEKTDFKLYSAFYSKPIERS